MYKYFRFIKVIHVRKKCNLEPFFIISPQTDGKTLVMSIYVLKNRWEGNEKKKDCRALENLLNGERLII